jgi:hypothetical protein
MIQIDGLNQLGQIILRPYSLPEVVLLVLERKPAQMLLGVTEYRPTVPLGKTHKGELTGHLLFGFDDGSAVGGVSECATLQKYPGRNDKFQWGSRLSSSIDGSCYDREETKEQIRTLGFRDNVIDQVYPRTGKATLPRHYYELIRPYRDFADVNLYIVGRTTTELILGVANFETSDPTMILLLGNHNFLVDQLTPKMNWFTWSRHMQQDLQSRHEAKARLAYLKFDPNILDKIYPTNFQ